MTDTISDPAEAFAAATQRHNEQVEARRQAAAALAAARGAAGALLKRHAEGHAVTTADLARAEEAEREAGRGVALAEARVSASRQVKERAEIAELHSQAEHLRADFVAASDAVVRASALVDSHMAAARAALSDRSAAAVRLQVAGRDAGRFDHEEMDAKARENVTLAKLHPGERPRCGVRLGAFPERLAGAALIDEILREPVRFDSLAARDAGLLGRPVPDPATTASPTTVA